METTDHRSSQETLPASIVRMAGLLTDDRRAYDAAENILIEADFNEHVAVVRFKALVRNDVGMLEAVLAHYLNFVSTEMPKADREPPGAARRPDIPTPTKSAPTTQPRTRRGADAIKSVQSTMKKTLLDTYRVLDGRIIGDLLYGDLDGLAKLSVRDGALLKMIKGHVANADPSTKVRDIIKSRDLERMVKQAGKIAADTVDAN